jgi:hypothetical protein
MFCLNDVKIAHKRHQELSRRVPYVKVVSFKRVQGISYVIVDLFTIIKLNFNNLLLCILINDLSLVMFFLRLKAAQRHQMYA